MHNLPETYRLIWTRSNGSQTRESVSQPVTKAEALRQFANVPTIRAACTPDSGNRLRVVSDAEWRKSEAARAAGMVGAR